MITPMSVENRDQTGRKRTDESSMQLQRPEQSLTATSLLQVATVCHHASAATSPHVQPSNVTFLKPLSPSSTRLPVSAISNFTTRRGVRRNSVFTPYVGIYSSWLFHQSINCPRRQWNVPAGDMISDEIVDQRDINDDIRYVEFTWQSPKYRRKTSLHYCRPL